MSWRDKLLPSSFKGVAFHIEDIEIQSGKRIAKFEFPKLNTPATESMGRKQRSYPVQAYLIGDNYLEDLTALITACESENAGILVHPFFGEISVECEDISVKQSLTRDGGFALVSMSFVEAGQQLFPSALEDKKSQLSDSKNNAIDISKKDFAKKFSVAGKGQFLINGASTHMSKWTSKMEGIMGSAKGESGAIAGIGHSIRNLSSGFGDMVSSPESLANNFASSISGLSSAFPAGAEGAKSSFGSYKKLFSSDNSASYNNNPLTETRKQELENQKQMDLLAVNVATLEAIEQATSIEYESYDEAMKTQAEILNQIDKICNGEISDELYFEVTKIRALFVELVPPKNHSLPELKKVKTLESENALTFSYRVFGNINNEASISKRNKISNPLSFPSDSLLEVPIE